MNNPKIKFNKSFTILQTIFTNKFNDMQNLYTENYKILLTGIKDHVCELEE